MSYDYAEKLKDPRWQKKRLKIFERDEWKCLCCGDSKETLHVHHLTYSKGDPWKAPDNQLETLCETCHEFRESFNEWWENRSDIPTKILRRFFDFWWLSFDSPEARQIIKENLNAPMRQIALKLSEWHVKKQDEREAKEKAEAAEKETNPLPTRTP